MADEHTDRDEVRVETPGPGIVVRHRGASVEVGSATRGPAPVEVRRGAAWLRADADGPGLVLTHGASTVQLRDGAAVVEVHDFEALVVVIAGRVAIKGTTALARSVAAGQAVTITLDGTFGDAEPVAAGELASDRMIVENLALDTLGAQRAGGLVPDQLQGEPAPVHRGAVDGPPPAAPQVESSALESVLVGVGVVDEPSREPPPAAEVDEGSSVPVAPEAASPAQADGDETSSSRRRLFLALVIAALIVVAVIAAVAFSAGAATAPPG